MANFQKQPLEVFCIRRSQKFRKFRRKTTVLLSLIQPVTLLKKRPWKRCFPRKFCEISKSTFSYRTRPVAASDFSKLTPSQSQMFDKVLNKTLWLPARKSANFANYLAVQKKYLSITFSSSVMLNFNMLQLLISKISASNALKFSCFILNSLFLFL